MKKIILFCILNTGMQICAMQIINESLVIDKEIVEESRSCINSFNAQIV